MSSSVSSTSREGEVRVLGLDPSLTSFGVCRLTMGRPGGKSFSISTDAWCPKSKSVSRLMWFKRALLNEIEEFNPHFIVLEGYAYAKGQGAHQIGELGGVLRLTLHELDIRYTEVAPAKLKKFITGKGNAKKEIVMVELYKRFAVDVPTTDEADASVLAIMGAVGGGGLDIELPQVNLSAIEGVVFV